MCHIVNPPTEKYIFIQIQTGKVTNCYYSRSLVLHLTIDLKSNQWNNIRISSPWTKTV